MDEQQVWDLYFVGICSIRFHPRNEMDTDEMMEEVQLASEVADWMLHIRRKRWQQ